MAIDYRALNSKTILDRFPLPWIDDILDSLGLSSVFTKLDLDSGYHKISLDPEDAHKTAFLSKWGLYEYTVLLLGLTKVQAIFLRLMNLIFQPWLDKGIAVYLDDIITYSRYIEDHVWLLDLILARLSEHRLFVIRSKYMFGVPTILFLGHIISSKGVQPDPRKIESIRLWPVPTAVHGEYVFLDIAGYYSCFVPKYTNKADALIDFLKKSNKWQLTTAAEESFELLILMLSTAPILLYPRFDFPFVYSTDASSMAIGAYLLEDLGLGFLPLSYASGKLTSAEQRYSTEDREILAIVFETIKWMHYLASGSNWVVCLTDRKPLKYVYSKKDLNKRLSRWIEKIVDVNPVILWVPGKELVVPDTLSCRPDYSKCSSLVIEPNFLRNVSNCTFDPKDVEMVALVASA